MKRDDKTEKQKTKHACKRASKVILFFYLQLNISNFFAINTSPINDRAPIMPWLNNFGTRTQQISSLLSIEKHKT